MTTGSVRRMTVLLGLAGVAAWVSWGTMRAPDPHSGHAPGGAPRPQVGGIVDSERAGAVLEALPAEDPGVARSRGWAGAVSVSGVALDASGRPVEGAQVFVTAGEAHGALAAARATTGSDGTFTCGVEDVRLGTVPGSLTVRGRAEAWGYATSEQTAQVVVPPGGERAAVRLVFVMVSGPTVLGRVLDEAGRAVRLARVCAIQVDSPEAAGGGDGTRGQSSSDAEGTFALTLDRPGIYDVWASARGSLPGWSRVVFREPGEVVSRDLVLEEGPFISGRVFGGDGLPVADAWVAVQRVDRDPGVVEDACPPAVQGCSFGEGRTDREGRYRIGGLLPGVYQVLSVLPRPLRGGLTLGDFSPRGVMAAVPGPPVNVVIQVGTLEVRTDPEAAVQFEYEVNGRRGIAAGHSFTLHLPAGSAFDVVVRAGGYESFADRGRSWPAGRRTATLRRIRPGG